jgi:hypothetical protein
MDNRESKVEVSTVNDGIPDVQQIEKVLYESINKALSSVGYSVMNNYKTTMTDLRKLVNIANSNIKYNEPLGTIQHIRFTVLHKPYVREPEGARVYLANSIKHIKGIPQRNPDEMVTTMVTPMVTTISSVTDLSNMNILQDDEYEHRLLTEDFISNLDLLNYLNIKARMDKQMCVGFHICETGGFVSNLSGIKDAIVSVLKMKTKGWFRVNYSLDVTVKPRSIDTRVKYYVDVVVEYTTFVVKM